MQSRIAWRALLALAVAAPFVSVPVRLDAQVTRRGGFGVPASPSYWVGLSYGYQNGTTIHDGETDGVWQFGYTSALRATLEKSIQPGFTMGVSASFSNAPLTYSARTGVDGSSATSVSCAFECSATANITQYMAFVHGGAGTYGFHGIYDLEAGLTEFSNFRDKSDDTRLPPTDAKYDFSFGLGGGLGYYLSRDADLYVTEMFDWVLHSQGENSSTSAPRISTFRAGVRIGF